MLIDPFTVIAQIVNFAILVVALKYFLYDRVIRAMDQREASIAERLTDAEQREADARHEANELRRQQAELDHERHELIDQARADAEAHRQHLLEDARADVDEERRRWQRGLAAEQRELQHELQRRTAHEVMEVSRQALSDLAQEQLEQRVIERALDHFAMQDEARDAVIIGDDPELPLTVRTAFAIPHDERARLVERLRTLGLDRDRRVRFEHDPDLVLGVEFLGDGTSVSWNAADYLARLGSVLAELVEDVEAAETPRHGTS